MTAVTNADRPHDSGRLDRYGEYYRDRTTGTTITARTPITPYRESDRIL